VTLALVAPAHAGGRYHRRVTRLSLLVELASMLAREVDLDAWHAAQLSSTRTDEKETARDLWLKVLEDGDDKEALERLVDDAIDREDHTEAATLLRRLANNITDPQKITAGQILTIPGWQAPVGKAKNAAKPAEASAKPAEPVRSFFVVPPVEQDLDAGLKTVPATDVPVIKVDEAPASAPKKAP
jgi:hypothetical protein